MQLNRVKIVDSTTGWLTLYGWAGDERIRWSLGTKKAGEAENRKEWIVRCVSEGIGSSMWPTLKDVLPRDSYVPPTFSAKQIEEATKQLRALMPVGMRPSDELVARAAKQLGISDELLFAIQNPGRQAEAQVENKSSLELKRDLAAMRPPVDPALRRRGY